LRNRPQWPRNRCIQFLLQQYEIGVIWSGMPRQSQLVALLNPKLAEMTYNVFSGTLNPTHFTSLPWQHPSAPLDPHLTHDSLGLFESTAQTANRSVQPFLCSSQQKVPMLYSGGPFPPKTAPSREGDGDCHLFHDSLRQTEPIIRTAP